MSQEIGSNRRGLRDGRALTDRVEPSADEAKVDEPQIDIPGLLARIAYGARLGPIIAGQRPSREIMGQQLVNLVNLYELGISAARLGSQIAEIDALVLAEERVVLDPSPAVPSPWESSGYRTPRTSSCPSDQTG
jgi:hypothetical protein